MTSPLRRLVGRVGLELARYAARPYIAGPELQDALGMCARLQQRGRASTIGYRNAQDEAPRSVADAYLAAAAGLARAAPGGYLSIKAPGLGYSWELLHEVLRMAGQCGVRVHFDSLGSESVDASLALITRAARDSTLELGCTLPGRWRRSAADVDTALRFGLSVRVVKGQWADVELPERDHRAGFLEVVDRLAGRAGRVAIATHDAVLAREALRRLQAAGTACELELLTGLPMAAGLEVAGALVVPVRVYVPYGYAWLPYALAQARRNPRLCYWLLRDVVVATLRSWQPRLPRRAWVEPPLR